MSFLNDTSAIDFETIRVRIDFTFRLMRGMTTQMSRHRDTVFKTFSIEQMQDTLSMIVTQALGMIYERRRKHGWAISEQELDSMRHFASVIVERLNALDGRIHAECDGLPITLRIGLEEGIINEGIDEVMKEVEQLLNLHQ